MTMQHHLFGDNWQIQVRENHLISY